MATKKNPPLHMSDVIKLDVMDGASLATLVAVRPLKMLPASANFGVHFPRPH
jgi:hypothetical protein